MDQKCQLTIAAAIPYTGYWVLIAYRWGRVNISVIKVANNSAMTDASFRGKDCGNGCAIFIAIAIFTAWMWK